MSFQIFEEVSSLIRSSANGEIHLSSSSSAIRIIRMPPGEIGHSHAAMVHPCSSIKPPGGSEVQVAAYFAHCSFATLHPGELL